MRSRPLQVVHREGRPRVERLDHPEAHRVPILHRGHPPAILGPTEDPQALGLPVLCIQVNIDDLFSLTTVKMLLQKKEAVQGSTLPLPQLRLHKARQE